METKRCTRCGATKPIDDFYIHPGHVDGLRSECKSCTKIYSAESRYRLGKATPMRNNPACGQYLGIYIAERILSHVFDNVSRMKSNNPGYDFVCGRGYKIDVKSSTRQTWQHRMWVFNIAKNKIADYFLCLAFDNRDNLNPEHLWLIPGGELNNNVRASISDTTLDKWAEYERPIDGVEFCCAKMKGEKTAERILEAMR